MKGWKRTAFGQSYNHYFRDVRMRPVCKSRAIFTTAEPTIHPIGKVCMICFNKQKEIIGN